MVLFIFEPHRALHLGGGVDEGAQRISGKGMVVTAGIDILELARVVEASFGVDTFKEETFNFVSGIQRVAILLVLFGGKGLKHAADVGGVHRPALVDHLAKHYYLAGAEEISRHPVKSAPVNSQPQVAFPLRGKPANRGAVKGEV